MLVSIVIPVYNAEKFVEECIKSALNQIYNEIEIIVVDDGSTDKSLKIIEKFSNQVKVISKLNGGTASALNTGIKEMKGDWFKWLSADDLLYPNAIKELVDDAKKLESMENFILYSNYDIIDSKSKILRQFIEPNYNAKNSFELNTILLDHYIGNATTSLIHKSAFERFGLFDENIGFAEDYELWLRLCVLHKFRLHLVPKILGKYRIHETQLSAKKMDKSLENAEKIRIGIINQMDKKEKEKYIVALKKYKNSKPLLVKVRHSIRNSMFKILPKSMSNSILEKYMKSKKKINEL
jgi:glycosyltransferase involved in cell wall biosynthesis